MGNGRYWLHTLGCPKNQVDSDKLVGTLSSQGYLPAEGPGDADLLVVNTCAFIEAARQESIDAVLELAQHRNEGAQLVVTGCMAERYGEELAEAIPEIDLVAGFGVSLTEWAVTRTRVPVELGARRDAAPSRSANVSSFDLLELPRPQTNTPWAYLKVAEGCDRICGFCAIPSFRGKQRSRRMGDLLAEVATLVGDAESSGTKEIVLVAQDLASYGRDRTGANRTPAIDRVGKTTPIVELTRAVSAMVERTRLLYLYPSGLTDELIEAVLDTGVPYFDLSLQHVARPLLARMRRWGDGDRFLARIARIRELEPTATFRSSFILGYPGETEEDHDQLLAFLEDAQLDWAGFFSFSPEDETHAVDLGDQVPTALAMERLGECAELQDSITATCRDGFVGRRLEVLVDAKGVGRSVHEAPEIDGVIHVPDDLLVGSLVTLEITASLGTDLVGALPGSPSSDVIGNGASRRAKEHR